MATTYWKFNGTAEESFASLSGFTARPGYVYAFNGTPPVEQSPLTGDNTVVTNWVTDPGPATDGPITMASDHFKLAAAAQPTSLRRTAAVAENFNRLHGIADIAALTLGQGTYVAIPLTAGQVVSKITFMSGTTAASSPTNQYFALYSPSLAKLKVTADDTTTAWAANTEKQLTLTTPYTVVTSGNYYVSCTVAGTTAPSLLGLTVTSNCATLAPAIVGKDTTHAGLTTPAGAPATATLAALGVVPWAWVA